MLACISGCGGVIGCIVAAGGVLCAKKFALRTKNGPKSAFCGVQGEFFTEMPVEGRCWASFFAPIGPAPVLDVARRTSGLLWWGFCSIRSWLAEYLRRVAALMMQFPPFGGGGAAS